MTTEPITVDIDHYKLQQEYMNDSAGACKYVRERLQLAGIPVAPPPSKGQAIDVTRGTLLYALGPVYLSYQWIPSETRLDFSGVEPQLPLWGTHSP